MSSAEDDNGNFLRDNTVEVTGEAARWPYFFLMSVLVYAVSISLVTFALLAFAPAGSDHSAMEAAIRVALFPFGDSVILIQAFGQVVTGYLVGNDGAAIAGALPAALAAFVVALAQGMVVFALTFGIVGGVSVARRRRRTIG